MTIPRRRSTRRDTTDLAHTLAKFCDAAGLPPHHREVLGIPGRRFRFDLAWKDHRVAVEVNGGVFTGGRHVAGVGYTKDLEKQRLAVLAGWTYLQFTGEDVKRRAGMVLDQIRHALEFCRGRTVEKAAPQARPKARKTKAVGDVSRVLPAARNRRKPAKRRRAL